MYTFEVKFYNRDHDEERMETIEVEEQFFDSVKEIYLYAMSKAYDMIKSNEGFDSLTFISC